jgi:hypothetical protein
VFLVAVADRHGGELQNYVPRVVIMAEQPAGRRPRSGTYFAQLRLQSLKTREVIETQLVQQASKQKKR